MNLDTLQASLQDLRLALLQHPLYAKLQDLEDLRCFAEAHVFAVWDFMSLLKALQRELTSLDLVWQPKGSPSLRRFINEIVWGEESDVDEQGQATSHYELYLKAMKMMGADSSKIEAFRSSLSAKESILPQIAAADLAPEIKGFLSQTFACIERGRLHELAAFFTLGREDLIPDMFHCLVGRLAEQEPQRLEVFKYYLERHIEVDGDSHGPLARQLMEEVCGQDAQKWAEAQAAARLALQARLNLWSGIYQRLAVTKLSLV